MPCRTLEKKEAEETIASLCRLEKMEPEEMVAIMHLIIDGIDEGIAIIQQIVDEIVDKRWN